VRRAIVVAMVLSLTAACSKRDASPRDSVGPATTPFTLASSAFQNDGTIPRAYTCDGANGSPPLEWRSPPARTAAFALIVEDPDAPGGPFIHWVLYDLPGGTTSLPGSVPKDGTLSQLSGARQGRTSFGAVGYGGPCPPPGPAHHYHLRLHALDAKLGLDAGATRDQVAAAMRGHELGQAELVGLYARAR
jgi:Raf kinase inhibitor-like YbhB/YbcL family protein